MKAGVVLVALLHSDCVILQRYSRRRMCNECKALVACTKPVNQLSHIAG